VIIARTGELKSTVPTSDVIGPASISVAQSIGVFQFFLPKLSDVRKANVAVDVDMVGDVRLGEVAAATVAIGIGTIISSLTQSSVPAVVSVIIAGTLICVYETALRNDRPLDPKNTIRSTDA
jgi:hypothetical protein